MCPSGKRRWARRGGAHRAAKRLTQISRSAPKHRNIDRVPETVEYYCSDCGGWHVMSRRQGRPRVVDA